MTNSQVIYMDVGCWQSYEGEEPVMTFALIEHNTIALCTYYSNGRPLHSTPFIHKEFEYDFNRTLTSKFLDNLLLKKYGETVGPYLRSRSLTNPKDFHIIKLIPFPSQTLLDDKNRLFIFIPDLHLHYFKLSYLDNFITWYENEWSFSKGGPLTKKRTGRVSMEQDFGIFLKAIADFQKISKIATRVYMLGDLTDMWEVEASIMNFQVPDPDKFLKGLEALIKDLYKNFQGKDEIGRFLKDLLKMNITKLPYDPIFSAQMSALKKDENTLKKICIGKDEIGGHRLSGENLKTKAKYIEQEILKLYKDKSGMDFSTLFANINWLYRIKGNHDNFLHISSTEPLYTFSFSGWNPPQNLPSNWQDKKADYLIMHGHEFDEYNNDEVCGLGYLIVSILVMFEAKKRGDLIKKFESILTVDAHSNYIKSVAPILYDWENKRGKKVMVVVQAHTHLPCLKDVTEEYKRFRNTRVAIHRQQIIRKFWRSLSK